MTENNLNQKIAKLDSEVEWFYSDDFKLEEATKKYQDTLKLAKEIETDLNNLKNEIEVLSEDFSKAWKHDIIRLWIIRNQQHQLI